MVLFKIRSFSVSKFDRCFYTSARETKARGGINRHTANVHNNIPARVCRLMYSQD